MCWIELPQCSMKKADLVKRLSVVMRGQRYTEDTVGLFVDLVFREVREALERGEAVQLRGFGTLKVVRRGARRGRLLRPGPLQGAPVTIPPRLTVRFVAGQWVRDLVAPVDVDEQAAPGGDGDA